MVYGTARNLFMAFLTAQEQFMLVRIPHFVTNLTWGGVHRDLEYCI